MERIQLSLIVGLVCPETHVSQKLIRTNMVIEDPSEFFSMVFGGEAFADW